MTKTLPGVPKYLKRLGKELEPVQDLLGHGQPLKTKGPAFCWAFCLPYIALSKKARLIEPTLKAR